MHSYGKPKTVSWLRIFPHEAVWLVQCNNKMRIYEGHYWSSNLTLSPPSQASVLFKTKGSELTELSALFYEGKDCSCKEIDTPSSLSSHTNNSTFPINYRFMHYTCRYTGLLGCLACPHTHYLRAMMIAGTYSVPFHWNYSNFLQMMLWCGIEGLVFKLPTGDICCYWHFENIQLSSIPRNVSHQLAERQPWY